MWLPTQYEVAWLIVLPGAPRTPNICRVGCCKGPNAERF
ncbi:Uncharacterised protein [Mycobacteroides abscessus subsp. abscessus]|nr:Uncharacterised protein [Mycobacteroides abscessus subsp. abscessus]